MTRFKTTHRPCSPTRSPACNHGRTSVHQHDMRALLFVLGLAACDRTTDTPRVATARAPAPAAVHAAPRPALPAVEAVADETDDADEAQADDTGEVAEV